MTTVLAAALLCASSAVAQPERAPDPGQLVSLETLLTEMTDRALLSRLPRPAYTCKQFSSYDRASVTPSDPATWFANNDVNHFLRTEDVPLAEGGTRKEWVMADMPGPGAVVRFWSANPKGTLRVYLDGSATPAIVGPMTEWLGGVAVPPPLSHEASKGWNLYMPIPYATHCKITSDQDGFYYQINYRTYEPGTSVQSFEGSEHEAALVSTAAKTLISPTPAPEASLEPREVLPGGVLTHDLSDKGPGEVMLLRVRVDAPDPAAAMRSTVLEASFDGSTTIWCPIGDFFGCGAGFTPTKDWYREVLSSGELLCRWVMPFQKGAKFTLRNLGSTPISAAIDTTHRNAPWSDRSMHFHTAWRHQYPIRTKAGAGTMDWNYIEISGKGVYVGDTLAVMNSSPAWWGEGDEKIFIDGESFPSHFGTGTEDYYGYAWCSPEPFQNPFHGQPRCDGLKATRKPSNYGHTTVSRVRSLDAIPFASSLKFDMEVWHWREADMAYAATTHFYARPGVKHNRRPDLNAAASRTPQPPSLPPTYRVPNSVECESMTLSAASEGVSTQPQAMEAWGEGKWSDDTQLWVKAQKPGDFVELSVPARGGRPLMVTLFATRSWDYGIVQYRVNGQDAGGPIDHFSGKPNSVTPAEPVSLGTFTPVNGRIVLRATLVGGNPKALGTRSFFGLDCITLTPP